MDKKAIVKLLEAALKNKDNDALNAIAVDLKMSRDDFDMIADGTLEISPALAMKLEQLLGVDAHDILSAQSADQLAILGKARTKKVEVPVAVQAAAKKTGTDGRPSQSPMRGMVSMTMVGVSDRQANKAVRAVMDSFAD